jgi:tRNA threonylcarbamoyladenosine biosynthesis protein TsaE
LIEIWFSFPTRIKILMTIIQLPNAEATKELGRRLGELLPAGSTVLLAGELGAGKTTLVQGIGEELGIKEPLVSPTFTLVNEYTEGRLPLYHMDLYRLQPEEIAPLYLAAYWEGQEVPPGITAIEWASRLPELPPHYLAIELLPDAVSGRQAKIESVGEFDLLQLQKFVTL